MSRLVLQRTVALGWFSRLLGMAVSLVMVRIALQLLGEGQFAVFQILTAALAWLSLSSFGLGPALKNLVSERRARGESDAPLRAASSTLLMLLFVGGGTLFVALAPTVSSVLLRKLSHDELWAYRAFVAGGLLSLIAVVGQVSMEVLYAEFRAARVYVLSMIASGLTVLFIWQLRFVERTPPELLFWVVCATLGPQAVIAVASLRMTGMLTLRLTRPDRAAVETILKLALRFWMFAVLSNLILMVDYLVISQILVAREIVLYSVVMKIAALGVGLFTTVIAVVWPEWTHDWELKRWPELRRRVLLLATIGAGVWIPGTIIAVYLLPILIQLWLHDANVIPSTVLILELCAYLAIRFWTDVHSSALMAGNRIAAATKFAVLQAIITAPLEYAFGRAWGAEGVLFGLLVGFVTTAAWMFPHRFYQEIRTLSATPAVAGGDPTADRGVDP